MMEVMDLIKCFYSTFIHYFLIGLVIKYFYMFISDTCSQCGCVCICKEEYLILFILNRR